MEAINQLFESINFQKIIHIIIIGVVGYLGTHLIALLVRKLMPRKLSRQSQMLVNKAIIYSGVVLTLLVVFNRMGLNITTILGAAGIVGVVIGIASQTSIGNIVSGLFLVSEKPFEIGDVLRVGDKTGVIVSIDLLSVKLKTFDNLYIRIPNQTIISTDVTNVTRFPIRRQDFLVQVAYKEDLKKVLDLMGEVAKANPLALNEPEPLILVKDFGESGINIQFGIWFEKPNYIKVRNSISTEILEKFTKEGIEIPFPHRTLYAGEITKPFPFIQKPAEVTPQQAGDIDCDNL